LRSSRITTRRRDHPRTEEASRACAAGRADVSLRSLARVRLLPYTDADLPLTEALETDPEVMRELGGPVARSELPSIHRRRLNDPWWFKIALEPSGEGVGTIGIWPKELGGTTIHETGWMVLPAQQGRGVASAALGLLLERVRAEPRFESVHAFPAVTNAPSNALCRKFGFSLLGAADFTYRGRTLRCHHWVLETPAAAPGRGDR
jgi:RimJ/RimL family protein N-acetyltransferase